MPTDRRIPTSRRGGLRGEGCDAIVVASSDGGPLVWYEHPDWCKHIIAPSGNWSCDAALADMDGDGQCDIVTAEMHQSRRKRVLAYCNLGDGTWERSVLAETGSHNLCVEDVAGTASPALVGANWSGDFQPVEMWQAL